MRVFRIAKSKYIQDVSGKGASLYGGRWNSIGLPAVYASTNISLAFLEILANMETGHIPEDLAIATIEFNQDAFTPGTLPDGWDSVWPSPVSQRYGDQLLLSQIAFQVPSIVIPQEKNIIFSPIHSDYEKFVQLIRWEPFQVDNRIKKLIGT